MNVDNLNTKNLHVIPLNNVDNFLQQDSDIFYYL